MAQPLVVKPPIKLAEYDPGFFDRLEKDAVREATTQLCKRVRELQDLLFANQRQAVLIVLQGMDASGKDGAVKRLLEFVDPHGIELVSFKTPSKEEDAHDFLWRIHRAVPRYGNIGVFNRSHYEEVLIDRALGWEPEAVWRPRFEMIRSFEKHLAQNGYVILKFFLHISQEEQAERLEKRLSDPTKVWKFDPSDLKMREQWNNFMHAYEDAMNETSTAWAPWHVVPANRKWYRDYVIARRLVEALDALRLNWPAPKIDPKKFRVK